MTKPDEKHTTIFLVEATKVLVDKAPLNKRAVFVDSTLGGGGHTKRLLASGATVIAIDSDPVIFAKTVSQLTDYLNEHHIARSNLIAVNDNFINLDTILEKLAIDRIDGVIFDFGISRMHYFGSNRGFSFVSINDPLDMRINPKLQGVKAADLLNALPERELIKLFGTVLTYRDTRRLVRNIIEKRKMKAFEKVSDLTSLIEKLFQRKGIKNPSTEAFLALRIAVNDELNNIKTGLTKAFDVLVPGGMISAISFHSLEDRIVKRFFREMEDRGLGLAITKKPIEPRQSEINANPSSRSARLRLFEKI